MKINHYIYALAGAALMLFGMAACSPDDYDLGDKDVTPADLVEGQAYTITHDGQNPNIVYLKSQMADRYQVNWIEPQGRSQEKEVTLKIPFPGLPLRRALRCEHTRRLCLRRHRSLHRR